MRIQDLKIRNRLVAGFLIVGLLVIMLGGISLGNAVRLGTNVEDIYNHPFTVSNAVLRIKVNIYDIHRKMKDIANAETVEDLEALRIYVERIENQTLKEFDVVEQRFLGEKDKVYAARTSFEDWAVIRAKVIDYSRSGKHKESAEITKNEGASHIELLETDIQGLIDFASNKAESFHSDSLLRVRQAMIYQIILLLTVIIVSILAGMILTNSITLPLQEVISGIEKIAMGDLVSEISLNQKDEIGNLASSFRKMQQNLKEIVEVSKKVADSDFSMTLTPKSEKDELSTSLNEMTAKLKKLSREQIDQNWLKSGQAKLIETLQGRKSIEKMTADMIHFMTNYLESEVGCIYVLEEGEYHLTGTHALTVRKDSKTSWKPGEGLVGQAALENNLIIIEEIPENYMVIASGSGQAAPRQLALLPCALDTKVITVLEIGSFKAFNEIQTAFLRSVADNIAIALSSAQARVQTEKLLTQTQEQSLILNQQQEELRASNGELEKKTKSLQQSEEELRVQQEELRATNEELEEKTKSLEEQKNVIVSSNVELEQASRDLEIKAKELEISSRYKSEFLANMSHELRTPLNSMLILAQDLKDNREKNLTDRQTQSADIIYRGGNDLLKLINEILDLSKIEAGKMSANWEEVELPELLDGIISNFKALTDEKNLHLTTHVDEDLPRTIRSDKQRLEQILRNLVSNAVKFTSKGRVSCTISRAPGTDERISIKVKDTGIGIPEDKHRHIFEAFQQVDSGISRKYGGTGLGLSIVREMIKLIKGEIRLKSKVGKGSTFELLIPIQPEEDPEIKRRNPKPVKTRESAVHAHRIADDHGDMEADDPRILVIEDDTDFAAVLRDFCHSHNMKFIHAGSGEQGLEFAEKFLPQGIILDIKLPGIDGREVLEELKNNTETRHIPVHMMSAMEESIDVYKMGAVGFLTKPAEKEMLEQAFNKMEELINRSMQKLLVVEDNEAMRVGIRQLIEDDEVQIVEVESGRDAIERIENEAFDCIILDLGLPDMTGFELLQKLEESKKIIKVPPVIIYTGMEITEEQKQELEKHAASIIIKGVKSRERLLDETTLFLHKIVKDMPEQNKRIINSLYNKDAHFEGKKILLVDDDMRNIFAIGKILEDNHMSVFKAANGQKALDLLAENPDIDLVLMDIMMPVMDGLEASKRIRAMGQFKSLPIIAVTAKAMKEDQEKCLESGANDYLSKPINMEQLLSLIRLWLYHEAK
ncbi:MULTISPECIES: response regulator [unclassified Oceanispirochaeta]|uniref:response regulator n=1 Tax=unclassified Oceanispirochaeta TaxID=2635722 RepID=UPI000E09AC45|nr:MULTISPECIES: response regulator [unclassified Oceanispirochaeta]MBF9016594.1 response regulator [Oceanispirochaeta sp. M2]NPD73057.1 response regulator [Oceanispirochaeta sp. M1]RDG31402.1 response regulator [Oceanispirochaeta sp. M1]